MNRYMIEKAVFSQIAKVKRCRSCFRCIEHNFYSGFDTLHKKPKRGAEVRCLSACSPEINGDMYHKACEWWKPRWYFNTGVLWWRLRYALGRLWAERVRIPLGALREPVALEWVDGLDASGQIVPDGDPKCPHCGEMPYSFVQCQFCGQRFI